MSSVDRSVDVGRQRNELHDVVACLFGISAELCQIGTGDIRFL